jgi:hypothetical protein
LAGLGETVVQECGKARMLLAIVELDEQGDDDV